MAQPLDDLLKNLGSLAPGIEALGQAGRDNIKASLQALLLQLDLVTREEFEIQQALLHRANQQLAELQHRLDALEDPSGTDGRDTEQTESD